MNMNCAIDLVSPERIQRIRELAKKATPTAWEADVIADIINERSGRESDAAYISAVHPGVVLAMCEEIELLRKSAAHFNKEAEWLADRCREFCGAHNFCAECPMLRGPFKRTNCRSECGEKITLRFEKNIAKDWRGAACHAVE